jgi:carotenoid cleavage dioxygenase-like enzyme
LALPGIYVFKPEPGYRLFRVPAGTNERHVLPDVPATPQGGERTASAPSNNHQTAAFTDSFVLLPEMPTRMAKAFSWKEVSDSYVPDGKLYWRVLDKRTGAPLGRYAAPPCWTWHNINAWENATHISVLASWAVNASAALAGFVTGTIHAYEGKLVRITMPNPRAPGAAAEGAADVDDLTRSDDPRVPMADFGVVHPAHMWRRPTRFIWGATPGLKATAPQMGPMSTVYRLDTSDGSLKTWAAPAGWVGGTPTFVPRDAAQSADSAAGVVVVLLLNTASGAPALTLLDGESHAAVANISLPFGPLSSPGLHNHWSEYPSSV